MYKFPNKLREQPRNRAHWGMAHAAHLSSDGSTARESAKPVPPPPLPHPSSAPLLQGPSVCSRALCSPTHELERKCAGWEEACWKDKTEPKFGGSLYFGSMILCKHTALQPLRGAVLATGWKLPPSSLRAWQCLLNTCGLDPPWP